MRRSGYVTALVLTVIFSFSIACGHSWAGERIYQMTGDITAIDLEYNTVVVEVPLAGKSFTVGGPLSSEAVLRRDAQTADLSDFHIGDRVIVRWKATEQGHVILSLRAK